MDFGSFDGSCTAELRRLVENSIIGNLFASLLIDKSDKEFSHLLKQALRARYKSKCDLKFNKLLAAVIVDMIRESGDRGTSISMMLEKYGYTSLSRFVLRKVLEASLEGIPGYDRSCQVVHRYLSMTATCASEVSGLEK